MVSVKPVEKKTVKVLYIAGETRSGSTLLGSILRSLPGIFSGGKPCLIYDHNLQATQIDLRKGML